MKRRTIHLETERKSEVLQDKNEVEFTNYLTIYF